MNILIAGIFGGTISYIFDKKGGHWRDLPKENHTKLLTKIVKLELKINEKLKLFRHVKQLVYSSDCHDIHEAILNFRTKLKINF